MSDARSRLANLERRADGVSGPCAACASGSLPVVTFQYPGQPTPAAPAPCLCGRPRAHIIVQYVDGPLAEVTL